MSNTTFTPGPWIDRNGLISPEGRGRTIASVNSLFLTQEEYEGNVNLIAAAPELFQALENYALVMEQFLATMPDEFAIDLIAAAVVRAAHEQARSAIYKAIGTKENAI